MLFASECIPGVDSIESFCFINIPERDEFSQHFVKEEREQFFTEAVKQISVSSGSQASVHPQPQKITDVATKEPSSTSLLDETTTVSTLEQMLLNQDIEITGLVARTNFNGQQGTTFSYDPQKGRYGVLVKGERLSIKQENLRLYTHPTLSENALKCHQASPATSHMCGEGKDEKIPSLHDDVAPVLGLQSVASSTVPRSSLKRGQRKGEFRNGEKIRMGSSMFFLGNTATPLGQPYSFLVPFDPLEQPYKISDRQLETSQAFVDAFSGCSGHTFLECHALKLCHHYNKSLDPEGMKKMDSRYSIQENVVLLSHRFLVSALPIKMLARCVHLACDIRQCIQRCRDTPGTGNVASFVPNTEPVFEKLQCSEAHRIDALIFLEEALNVGLYETVIAFSEPDAEVILVHRGFQQPATVLAAETEEEAISAVKPSFLQCYWCRKSAACMESKMLMCGGCKQMDYCSKSCQNKDWKAFHKKEYKALRGKTKTKVGLKETRKDSLHAPGGLQPTINLPLGGDVWDKDSLQVYMCNIDLSTCAVGKDTFMFPHGGFKFLPRELAHLDRDFSRHALSAAEQLEKFRVVWLHG